MVSLIVRISKFFLSRSSGEKGKAFLINTIQVYLKLQEKMIVSIASSAVAAILPKDGKTAYSKFPFPITSDPTCQISVHLRFGNDLRGVYMTIWDEIGMAHRNNVEETYCTLKNICNVELPFGVK